MNITPEQLLDLVIEYIISAQEGIQEEIDRDTWEFARKLRSALVHREQIFVRLKE